MPVLRKKCSDYLETDNLSIFFLLREIMCRFGNCVKISLEVAICNEKADSLSYSQGIDNVFVVVEKKNLVFHIIFIDFLKLMG